MEPGTPRKYKASFLRMLLLFYPFWLVFSFIAALTDPTVGSDGFIYLALAGLLIMNLPGLVAQLYYVTVDRSGIFIKSSSVQHIQISWKGIQRVKPKQLLHFRYVRIYHAGQAKPLWLNLSVRDSRAFIEEIIKCAPAGNPLRVYLETGELVERTVPGPLPSAMPATGIQQSMDNRADDRTGQPRIDSEERLRIEQRLQGQMKSGANWFYWIAGLSLVNMLAILIGVNWNFVIGLAVTQIIDAVAAAIATDAGAKIGLVVRVAAVFLDVLIAGVFVLFGAFANKKYEWAFITGMVLYVLDGVLFLFMQDYLGIVFHLLALYGIFMGYKALRQLKRSSAADKVDG